MSTRSHHFLRSRPWHATVLCAMTLMTLAAVAPVCVAAPTRTATPTRTRTRTPTATPTRSPVLPFSFGRRSSYPLNGATALATGDFDGDGRPDIAAIGMNDDGASTVTIWFTQADGTFRAQPDAITASGFFADGFFIEIAAGKMLNGDQLDDIAVLGEDAFGNDALQVYANLGGPQLLVSFQPRGGMLPVGQGPVGLTALDLIGDGSANALAVANSNDSPGTVSLFTRTGPNFTSALAPVVTGRDLSESGFPVALGTAAGRLGNDSLPDIAVALNGDLGVAVHMNTGSPGNPAFAGPMVYDPNPDSSNDIGPTGVVIADFNRDGHPDIALSNEGSPGSDSTSGSVTIHLSHGDGTFANAVVYPIDSASVDGFATVDGLATADFNKDGVPDLITRGSDDTLTLLYGNGDGTIHVAPNLGLIPVGAGLAGMAVADFNGDGQLDVAVVEADDNTISVLLGGGVVPPPTPSLTPTVSPTTTKTPTPTRTPTRTRTPTVTQTPTITATALPTMSATPTLPPSATPSATVRTSPSVTPTAAPGIPGDANCDGTVTRLDLDALLVRLFEANLYTQCRGADANTDQDITAADIPRALQIIP